VFLIGYFTLAGGITILQVAANPYVALLGSEDGASSRLNLSQAFNSLGTTIAPVVGALFLLSDSVKNSEEIALLSEVEKSDYYLAEAATVQTPFLAIAGFIGILALLFFFIKLPKLMEENPKGGYIELLKNKLMLMGALGIFVYVGAEVAIGSFLVNYFYDMGLASVVAENETMMNIANTIAKTFNQTFSGKVITDLVINYEFSEKFSANLSASNLLDVYPDEIETNGDVVTDLGGRFKYPWEVNQFGFNGTTINGSITFKF
jgi:FHS family L-fucose permease-like MFS transporter